MLPFLCFSFYLKKWFPIAQYNRSDYYFSALKVLSSFLTDRVLTFFLLKSEHAPLPGTLNIINNTCVSANSAVWWACPQVQSALPAREGGYCTSPHLEIVLLLQLPGYDESVLCSTAPQPLCLSVILSQVWTEDLTNIPESQQERRGLHSPAPLCHVQVQPAL